MPRIFLPHTDITDRLVTATGEQARYLTSVLRSSCGDMLTVTDDRGTSYDARITSISKKTVTAEVIRTFRIMTESPLRITLLQGLPKGDKMDLIVQKTTELGIGAIIPVITSRSQVRETRKVSRWRKIAEEASRLSGRTLIPEIHEPVDFASAVLGPFPQQALKILFWEDEGSPLSTIVRDFTKGQEIIICSGSEGGFCKEEIELAGKNNYRVASLGKRILRAETAPITAVSILQYQLGDMG